MGSGQACDSELGRGLNFFRGLAFELRSLQCFDRLLVGCVLGLGNITVVSHDTVFLSIS